MQMTVVTNIPLLESTLTFIFVYMSIFFFLVLPFLSLVGTFFLVQYNINTKILVLFNVFTMFFLFIISLILFFTFSFFDVKFFFLCNFRGMDDNWRFKITVEFLF